jgi:hypothetical protein
MTMLNDYSFWEPGPHVKAAIDEFGIVLLDTHGGVLFTANRVGADIWTGLQQHLSDDGIATELSERYGVTPASALADTHAFVSQLGEARLIVRGPR